MTRRERIAILEEIARDPKATSTARVAAIRKLDQIEAAEAKAKADGDNVTIKPAARAAARRLRDAEEVNRRAIAAMGQRH